MALPGDTALCFGLTISSVPCTCGWKPAELPARFLLPLPLPSKTLKVFLFKSWQQNLSVVSCVLLPQQNTLLPPHCSGKSPALEVLQPGAWPHLSAEKCHMGRPGKRKDAPFCTCSVLEPSSTHVKWEGHPQGVPAFLQGGSTYLAAMLRAWRCLCKEVCSHSFVSRTGSTDFFCW